MVLIKALFVGRRCVTSSVVVIFVLEPLILDVIAVSITTSAVIQPTGVSGDCDNLEIVNCCNHVFSLLLLFVVKVVITFHWLYHCH